MKRIIIALSFLIIASFAFQGCEKEKVVSNPLTDTTIVSLDMLMNMSEEEYSSYLDNLIQQTGIDIYQLGESEAFSKANSKVKYSLNILNQDVESKSMQPHGGTLTEEKIEQMQVLFDSISYYINQGMESEALLLYNDFCSICNTIDGFVLNSSEYGVQTISFDDNTIPYPSLFMQEQVNLANNCIEETSNRFPSYKSLSDEKQIEVLSAIHSVNILKDINNETADEKSPYVEDECIKEAKRMYALSMGLATAAYQAGLIYCAFTSVVPAAAATCIAFESALYGVACASASYQFYRAKKNCEQNN